MSSIAATDGAGGSGGEPRRAGAAFGPHPPLVFDDGAPYSTLFGDIYRSRRGAADESRQVFIAGSGLTRRWVGRPLFTVLEVGFGLGVNFLQTLRAWRADPGRPRQLFYVGIEAHPLSATDLAAALRAIEADAAAHRGRVRPGDWPDTWPSDDTSLLIAHWPPALPGLHRIEFPDRLGTVRLLLAFGDAATTLRRLVLAADVIYLDGFAPSRNPDAWSDQVLRGLARLSRPGTTLASYSCAAPVRRALADAGFDVTLAPGFSGKHQRLQATYAPRWKTWPAPPPSPTWPARTATVIGAGLAGTACAAALADRGWQIHLIEARGPAQGEGSSQPLCAEHLHLSPDDNLAARLTRTALMLARQTRWTGRGAGAPIGRLVLPADDTQLRAHQRLVTALGFPQTFVQMLDAAQASDRAGIRLARGGLWLPMASAQRPAELCAHWMAHAAIRLSTGLRIGRIGPGADSGWTVHDTHGRLIGRSDVLILANADDAVRLASLTSARPRRIAGQTTWLAGRDVAALRCTLGGGAYACPAGDGRVLIGATFEDADGFVASEAGDRVNIGRFTSLIGRAPGSLDVTPAGQVPGIRCAMPDRMPMIGPLPDEARIGDETARLANDARLPMPRRAGLYGVFALGARGLLYAPLAAELIAAQLDGEPLPIESDLLAAIDPARYAVHRLRRMARPRRAD